MGVGKVEGRVEGAKVHWHGKEGMSKGRKMRRGHVEGEEGGGKGLRCTGLARRACPR